MVEISIALGIVSFAIIAIISLLTGMLGTEQENSAHTSIPQIAALALHDLKIKRAADLSPSKPDSYTFYFTGEGAPATSPTLAAYTCEIALSPVVAPGMFNPGASVLMVHLTFRKGSNSPVIQTLHATIQDE
jgi:hypothetical protein